jgi:trimethylamine:corrinoid methyltransferase-like protein
MRHFRDEIFQTEIAETQTFEVWKKQGGKDTRERAREKARRIISGHQPEPLNVDVERHLREYVAHVERREKVTV